MKKLLMVLPVLVLVLVAGVAFSKPEPTEKPPSQDVEKRMWHNFPHSGMRLGVVLSENDSDAREGVRVERVIPGSPADKGGLQEGDVILSLDGEKVAGPRDVRDIVQGMDEERTLQVQVERDGKPLTLQITPEKREGFHLNFGNRMYLGLNLQELDPDLASYFQATPGSGVLVTRVESDSPAAKAGVRSGDVITHINGEKVSQPSDIVSKMENVQEGDSLEMTVLRHGAEKKLTAKPEKRSGMDLPDVGQMFRDHGPGMEMPDFMQRPEFQQNMESLQRDMNKLRDEMQLNKEDMQKLKDQIQEEVHREMDKLRQELKDRKNAT